MAVTYAAARQMIGRHCIAQLHDGRRHIGVVQRVTRDGIYMRPIRGGQVSGTSDLSDITTADRPHDMKAEKVFFPLLFLPFLALAALSPWWGWGGYGGYYGGYGGYWW